MSTRRDFIRTFSTASSAAVALPAMRSDGMRRVMSANAGVVGRTPQEVAEDENFWFEIQQAFTVDRSLVNLNNGGVSPEFPCRRPWHKAADFFLWPM